MPRLLGLLFITAIGCVSAIPAAKSQIIRDDLMLAQTMRRITYYDKSCAFAPMPDGNYAIIENIGIDAIPTLLKAIAADGVNSGAGGGKTALIASCLIERITNTMRPLNWPMAYAILGSGADVGQRQQFQQEIINQLKQRAIMSCERTAGGVTCMKTW